MSDVQSGGYTVFMKTNAVVKPSKVPYRVIFLSGYFQVVLLLPYKAIRLRTPMTYQSLNCISAVLAERSTECEKIAKSSSLVSIVEGISLILMSLINTELNAYRLWRNLLLIILVSEDVSFVFLLV